MLFCLLQGFNKLSEQLNFRESLKPSRLHVNNYLQFAIKIQKDKSKGIKMIESASDCVTFSNKSSV